MVTLNINYRSVKKVKFLFSPLRKGDRPAAASDAAGIPDRVKNREIVLDMKDIDEKKEERRKVRVSPQSR